MRMGAKYKISQSGDRRKLESALADSRLSWSAKGIMASLERCPTGSTLDTETLVTASCDDAEAVKAGFVELLHGGYLRIVRAGVELQLYIDHPDGKKVTRKTVLSALPEASLRRFAEFWASYPRKVGKYAVQVKWVKLGCDAFADRILASVQQQKRGEQWRKDNGRFIPNPETWLNQGRWDDEVAASGSFSGAIPVMTADAPHITIGNFRYTVAVGPQRNQFGSDSSYETILAAWESWKRGIR